MTSASIDSLGLRLTQGSDLLYQEWGRYLRGLGTPGLYARLVAQWRKLAAQYHAEGGKDEHTLHAPGGEWPCPMCLEPLSSTDPNIQALLPAEGEVITDEWREVWTALFGTENLLITGRAGTGKSRLLQHFMDVAPDVLVLAPTGVAARNVGGSTIHSAFHLPGKIHPHEIEDNPARWQALDLAGVHRIVIDEVSMVRSDLLDCVDTALRVMKNKNAPFGGVQVILFGDPYQLPPVATPEDWNILRRSEYRGTNYWSKWFWGAKVMRETFFRHYSLTTVFRQRDAAFLDMLNAIRDGEPSPTVLTALNARVTTETAEDCLILTPTRAREKAINDMHLAELPDAGWPVFTAKVTGRFPHIDYPTGTELYLKPGTRVMMLNNDPSHRWVNGSLGFVLDIGYVETKAKKWRDDGSDELRDDGAVGISLGIIVALDSGEEVRVPVIQWDSRGQHIDEKGRVKSKVRGVFQQLPVRLAWAVTIHKSQGLTLDRCSIDPTGVLRDGMFDAGQLYVALSRVRTFDGLSLTQPLTASSVRASAEVKRYMNHQPS